MKVPIFIRSKKTLLALFLCAATMVDGAFAAPIYVFKEADGSIRFTTTPPPQGVRAKIFTASSINFSTYRSGQWRGRGAMNRQSFQDLIEKSAREYGVDAALLRAIIHVESAFNPMAVSPKGAQGLMQLMPGTARMHGVQQPFEPAQNIAGGARHIAQLLRKYQGNVQFALAAYNAGEEAVEQYRGIPPYSETRNYVQRVQAMKERYSKSG